MGKDGRIFFGEGLPYVDVSDIKGKLIVIEGTDGVGRSSQVEELKKWLEIKSAFKLRSKRIPLNLA